MLDRQKQEVQRNITPLHFLLFYIDYIDAVMWDVKEKHLTYDKIRYMLK